MKFILKDHWRGPEDADSYDRNPESHPEHYGLKLVARFDYSHDAYQFDYRLVWADSTGRLWTARDAGCSCPTPFEDTEYLDRLFSSEELAMEYFEKEYKSPYRHDHLSSLHEFTRFKANVDNALKALSLSV